MTSSSEEARVALSSYGKLTILDGEKAEVCPGCGDSVLRLVTVCDYCGLRVCPGCIQSQSTESGFCCDKAFCRRCDGSVQVACQGCKAPRCKLCIYPACKDCDRLLCSKCHVIGVSFGAALIPRSECGRDWVRSGQRCNTLQAIAMIAISVLGVAALAVYFLVFFERKLKPL